MRFLLAGLFTLISMQAIAEGPLCLPLADMTEKLVKAGESKRAAGLSKEAGFMFAVFATDDGSAWTLLILRAAKRDACIIDYGTDFQSFTWGPES